MTPSGFLPLARPEWFLPSAAEELQKLMLAQSPLMLSRLLLAGLGTQLSVVDRDRVPQEGAVLVVSNHRSYMDAPLLIAGLDQPIRFACHHYMGQVPMLRDIVQALGCFPLDAPEHRQQSFFVQATRLLQEQQFVGIFPEGGQPIVQTTQPDHLETFQRGFAHLALRAPLTNLTVLPVAIAAHEEITYPAFPLHLLKFFDPSEALFEQEGWHPLVTYRRVSILVGRPHRITAAEQHHYRGKRARSIVTALTDYCQAEIAHLLQRGFA